MNEAGLDAAMNVAKADLFLFDLPIYEQLESLVKSKELCWLC